jgi:hypothetical protein
LEDALRGILEAGGDINEDWSIDKTLKTGDQAVGLDVLEKLYAEWKDKPVQVDLPAMWKELGVESVGGTVQLKSDAPLSAIRKAIEAGTPNARAGENAAPRESDADEPVPGREAGAANASSAAARPLAVFAGRTPRSN